MIDTFALALSHGLLIFAAWRLLFRSDLDDENAEAPSAGTRGARIADALKKVRKRA